MWWLVAVGMVVLALVVVYGVGCGGKEEKEMRRR